ncbi:MAG: DUF2577 domain-containing protein [Clostridium sp.]
MSLLNVFKEVSIAAMHATNPVEYTIGEVTSVSPLKIKVEQRLELAESFFLIPQSLTRYEIDLQHSHPGTGVALNKVTIREGLLLGDSVLLTRKQGGEQYIVLDKLV